MIATTKAHRFTAVAVLLAALFTAGCSPREELSARGEFGESTVDLVMSLTRDLTQSITHNVIVPDGGHVDIWGQVDADVPVGPYGFIVLLNFRAIPAVSAGDRAIGSDGQASFQLSLDHIESGGDLRIITRLPGDQNSLKAPVLRAWVAAETGGTASISEVTCAQTVPQLEDNPTDFVGVLVTERGPLKATNTFSAEDSPWIAASSMSEEVPSVLVAIFTDTSADVSATTSSCWLLPANPSAGIQWVELPDGSAGEYQALLIPSDSASVGSDAFMFGGDLSSIVTVT